MQGCLIEILKTIIMLPMALVYAIFELNKENKQR